MADPVTLAAIITGLVGAYKAYADYKAATAKAATTQAAPPARNAEAAQGEQAAPLVKAAVQQHGDAKEQTTLTLFEGDPGTYHEALARTLTRLAERSPAFAQQLQTLAQQANIQTGGIQGKVEVSGQGRIDGVAVGVSTGSITYTGAPRPDDPDKQSR